MKAITTVILIFVGLTSSTGLALDFNSMIKEGVSAEETLRNTLRGEPTEVKKEREKKLVRVSDEIKETQVESGDMFTYDKAEAQPVDPMASDSEIEAEILGLSGY